MKNYDDKGKVVMVWEGNNGTYWTKIQYWIGVGYQYVDTEINKETYDLLNSQLSRKV